jgi:hypothetical protein
MKIPPEYTQAQVEALFGVERWLFERVLAPKLHEVGPERRRGRPCRCFGCSSVHALYRQTFGILPTPDQIDEALRKVQLTRLKSSLTYTKRRIEAVTATEWTAGEVAGHA